MNSYSLETVGKMRPFFALYSERITPASDLTIEGPLLTRFSSHPMSLLSLPSQGFVSSFEAKSSPSKTVISVEGEVKAIVCAEAESEARNDQLTVEKCIYKEEIGYAALS